MVGKGLARLAAPLRLLVRLVRKHPRASLIMFLGAAAGVWFVALPAWADLQQGFAEDALAAGRTSEARVYVERALPFASDRAAALRLAARVERTEGQYARAESYLQRCRVVEEPTSEATQLEWVLLRAQRGEVDRVAPGLMYSVRHGHPEARHILETLARVYMHELRLPANASTSCWP
jgi:tetratricopeptide (TPR) repeat protein